MTYARYSKRTTTPTPIKPMREPSPYQHDILDWLANDTGNAIVRACPGSGKTTTLEMCANTLPSRVKAIFLAFNKAIATELSERLPFPAMTFHALGYKSVRVRYPSVKMDAQKLGTLADNLYPSATQDGYRSQILRLVSLVKGLALLPANVTTDLITSLCDTYGIVVENESINERVLTDATRTLLAASLEQTTTLDFDDMLYWPIVLSLPFDTFDFVMVDEAQDLNDVQRAIVQRLMKSSSRLLAVGDEDQAIYGFRGASHDSMQQIADAFKCKDLPLSITYRCATAIVELAQQYASRPFVARDGAPAGTINTPPQFAPEDFLPTDLVVCRNTAPLVRTAYSMLARRIPCRIMGREIGQALVKLVERIAGKRGTLENLPMLTNDYRERETLKLRSRKLEAQAQAVEDRCECILTLLDTLTPEDCERGIVGLTSIIASMFDDSARGLTTLATIHKSKGLEASRVIIIDWHLCPSKYARTPEQQVQERNLQLVAVTRAKTDLLFVGSRALGGTD